MNGCISTGRNYARRECGRYRYGSPIHVAPVLQRSVDGSLLVEHDPHEKELLKFLDEAADREGWEA